MMHTSGEDGPDSRPVVTTLEAVLQRIRTFMGTRTAWRLVLGLFIVQAVLLAFIVRFGTPPDETNHIRFIQYYAGHSLSPIFTNQRPTFNLGDKTREVDYLYHYTMSLLYRVLPLSAAAKYITIRLFSVLFAVLCFIVLSKVFRRLGLSAAVITLTLLILTNLPMVLMMSSAVNNDVMVWLGAALGLLLLLRLWERPRAVDLLWLFALSVTGGIVKRTLLPLGLLFGVLGLMILIRHFRGLMGQLRRFDWRLALAAIVLLAGCGLFVERVGGNLVRYHTITPSCEQVDGTAPCTVFWVNVRARSLAEKPHETPITPPMFALLWVGDSLQNVVDIQTQGWRHQVMPAFWAVPALGACLIAGTAYGFYVDRGWWRKDAGRMQRLRMYIMLITLYFMTVHMLVNYSSYHELGFFGLALNGRYILPSLLPLAGLACFYWSKLLARHPSRQVLLAIFLVLTTILGSGLLMMIRNPQLHLG